MQTIEDERAAKQRNWPVFAVHLRTVALAGFALIVVVGGAAVWNASDESREAEIDNALVFVLVANLHRQVDAGLDKETGRSSLNDARGSSAPVQVEETLTELRAISGVESPRESNLIAAYEELLAEASPTSPPEQATIGHVLTELLAVESDHVRATSQRSDNSAERFEQWRATWVALMVALAVVAALFRLFPNSIPRPRSNSSPRSSPLRQREGPGRR